MDADRAVDIGIALGERFDVSCVFDAHANTEKVTDAALTSRFEGRVKRAGMFGKVEAIKVAMGIYEHKAATTSYEWDGRTSGLRPDGFRFCFERCCHYH